MYKISELVGIFEGISFDGVINDAEVREIKDWLRKNRYTAQAQIEVALINILDATFIDGEIVKENKDDAETFCHEYTSLPEYINDISKLFELYGIITGITCDGIINDIEKNELSQWLSKNKKFVFNKDNKELISLFANIYSNPNDVENIRRIITEIIQQRKAAKKIEWKIDYLRELVREGKNLGSLLLDFLSDINDFKFIHDKAEKILNKYLESYTGSKNSEWEYVIISLSIMEMLEYKGNFYDVVKSKYKTLYDLCDKEQRVEGAIRDFISLYSNNPNNKRKINVILENTLVPKNFLPDFFDFIYDVYEENFNHVLPEKLNEEISAVYNALQEELSDNEEEIIISSKSYKLLRSTRRLMRNANPTDGIVTLSTMAMELIDSYLWGKSQNRDNAYLQYGFAEWLKKHGNKLNKRYRTRKSSENYSRWQPRFKLRNSSQVILDLPTHNINNCFDYTAISILVEEKSIMHEYNHTMLDIRTIIGGFKIMSHEIVLNHPLDNVSYKVLVGGEAIYDSREQLYRDKIIFDDNGQELRNNTDYSGMAYICCSYDIENEEPAYKCAGYKLYACDAEKIKKLVIGDDTFNFISKEKSYLAGKAIKDCYIYDKTNTESLQVYSSIEALCVNIDDKFQYEIVIDNKPRKLQSLPHEKMSYQLWKFDLRDFHLQMGIHRLFVYKVEKKHNECVFKKSFAIDNVQFSAKSITDKIYSIDFSSKIFLCEFSDYDINIKNYRMDMLSFKNEEGNEYVYKVPFKFKLYRLDGGEWCSFDEYIWGKDVKSDSTLELWGTGYKKLTYREISLGSANNYIEGYSSEDITTVFKIGELKSNTSDILILHFEDGSQIRWYNKCVLDRAKTSITYDSHSHKLNILPVCFGKDSLSYAVSSENGSEVAAGKLTNGQVVSVDNIEAFKIYRIRVSAKPSVLFAKEYVLLDSQKSFFSAENLENKTFKIVSLTCDPYIKRYKKFKRETHNVRHMYIRYLAKFDKGYEAEILKKKRYARHVEYVPAMKILGHIKAEICNVEDKAAHVYLSTMGGGDGLLMNREHPAILDNDAVKNAEDIYWITMKIEPVLQGD